MTAVEAPLIASAFVVSGKDFDPHCCTTAFGLRPTEVTVRGELRPGKRPRAPSNSWYIEVQRDAYSIDDVLKEVLDIVWPKREAIKVFTESASLRTTFVVDVKIYCERPEYSLSPATIERMAYFQAEFGLDIFDMSK